MRAKSSRAARSTIEPTIITVRDATVGPESGTTEVDGVANSTRSIETQSASAAICRKTVSVPWPMSVDAVRIRKRGFFPDGPRNMSIATRPFSLRSPEPVKPAPCRKTLAPMPRALRGAEPPGAARRSSAETGRAGAPGPSAARFLSHPLAFLASSTQRWTPTDSFRNWPVGVVSPTRRRFFSRSSSGSADSSRAIRSMCRSIAQIVCGAPKPRKAPFGGVFVATATASIATCSQR